VVVGRDPHRRRGGPLRHARVLARRSRPAPSEAPGERGRATVRQLHPRSRRTIPMTDAFVLGGVRTPVGRYGGSLSHIRTDDLLGQTMVWACERVGVDLDRIEDIAAGCVNPAHEGMGDIARWAALAAGFPDSVPAATVNRFCASSLSGAISIAHAIRSEELSVGLAGGAESMSRSGWALMKGEAPFMPRGP